MLELKNIRKTYTSGNEKVEALKGIDLAFRESEFVSILGQSGCGKTTLLNIIGGLDRYTSGDLIINGKSTKKFKDRDWDAYRNFKIGFVFQGYNLIGHQTILSNVELALTIGGITKKERRERAIKALEDVGLKEHIYKKPNQLSGGQMQRVAIARALVNNPDIILADEPTGALDTKTSVQVMEILKKISKNKLIIMVTHNPELAEKYSSRIIKILDGVITEDSNPILSSEEVSQKVDESKIGRTSMRLWTALRLSLNNLLTKKGRTILVSFAGSIGIIGIALVQSVSNGFQAYVDSIQEETLTSYPLTVMSESTDIAGTLLSMRPENIENSENTHKIKEEQYISKVLDNLSTNDLKSFKTYLQDNYDKISNDLTSIKYGYNVEPVIFGIDEAKRVAKLSPSNIFGNAFSSSFSSGMMSTYTSVYSQMMDDEETIKNSYDILAGHLPKNYDEMMIVLSDRNTISDLLVYSLGLRDTQELQDIVSKMMKGEIADINNTPLEFTYEDLMNTELKLIMPSDFYKYNSEYNIFEDMSENEEFIRELYDKAPRLKIVGIITAKEGVTSAALNPGVAYTSSLVDHIIEYSSNTEIVKKQLENEEIDVISNSKFDEKKSGLGLDFKDFISIDTNKLQSAFNIKIDQNQMQNQTQVYMTEISNAISTDTRPAKEEFMNNLNSLASGVLKDVNSDTTKDEIDTVVENYLNGYEPSEIFKSMEQKYVIPKATFKTAYSGLLKALVQIYVSSIDAAKSMIPGQNVKNNNNLMPNANDPGTNIQNESLQGENANNLNISDENITNNANMNTLLPENINITEITKVDIVSTILPQYLESAAIQETGETMARAMTEAVMKKTVLTKVGELTGNLTKSVASAFNVDQDKIANSFKMKMTEEEITRIISAMISDNKESNAKTNLASFGYQDKDEPTYISFYFKSFDGKEHFKSFIDEYNEKVKSNNEEDKEIRYTDTTGILMGSVKTIVNAVTYVLIAFISISLVVSSMMIGIITYISVYERTKEIGILRAIGASKKNISSIFNAETFIIGLLSGLIGVGFTYSVVPTINSILHKFTGNIPLNVTFYISNAVVLVILSIVLTLIGGIIPAKSASKRDPVIALRTE